MAEGRSAVSQALARAFVQCKHWRWVDGMRPMRLSGVIWQELPVIDRWRPETRQGLEDAFPSLDDMATRGAILGLVRVAHGDDDASVGKWHADEWECWVRQRIGTRFERSRYRGKTMSEALLAALQAAP